jgi:hypothetical protein
MGCDGETEVEEYSLPEHMGYDAKAVIARRRTSVHELNLVLLSLSRAYFTTF